MATEAEASREARAKVIAAEGEMKSSLALKQASDIICKSPAALQLRYLQTLNSIASEKNSTIIFPLPFDMMKGVFCDKWRATKALLPGNAEEIKNLLKMLTIRICVFPLKISRVQIINNTHSCILHRICVIFHIICPFIYFFFVQQNVFCVTFYMHVSTSYFTILVNVICPYWRFHWNHHRSNMDRMNSMVEALSQKNHILLFWSSILCFNQCLARIVAIKMLSKWIVLMLHFSQDVTFAEQMVFLLVVQFDFSAAVFGQQNFITSLEWNWNKCAGLVKATWTNGNHNTLRYFALGSFWNNDAALGLSKGFGTLYQDPIQQRDNTLNCCGLSI